jgi:arylsulfatase A-like enzyme
MASGRSAQSNDQTTNYLPLLTARTAKPNIILILTDDLDLELGTIDTMPKLHELLINKGITFTNFFVNVTLCCPSRVSTLRGQYVHSHQVMQNQPPTGGFYKFQELGLEDSTIATELQNAGYRTALMGKYLNGYPFLTSITTTTYIPPGWNEWYSPTTWQTAYESYNYTLNENGKLVQYGNDPEDHLTDVLSTKATDFISRTVAMDRLPFFLFLTPYAPHEPSTATPRHLNLFTNLAAPRTPSFNEMDVTDKPQFIRDLPFLSEDQIADIDQRYQKRLQSMQDVDDMIENLVQILIQTGQLGNTYIFFTSDNGFHLGQHRLLPGKYYGYEEDIHVPLFVIGPDIPAGRSVEYLAGIVDLAPTFEELAGANTPSYLDGRSLVPLLGSHPQSVDRWRKVILFEQFAPPSGTPSPNFEVLDPLEQIDNPAIFPEYAGLRTAQYHYILYGSGESELYDLSTDPYELNNLQATVDPVLIDQFEACLRSMQACVGASCRSIEESCQLDIQKK